MNFAHYWNVLLKQWKIIVACFLLVGIGTFIGSKIQTPLYQSSTLVEVALRSGTNQSADYSSLMASDQLVQTEAQLATSNTILRQVASQYQGMTVEKLAQNVSASAKLNTQLFEIDVLDPNPSRAAAIANDIATTLIKNRVDMTQQDNARSQQGIQQNLDATQQQINKVTAQIAALQGQQDKQQQLLSLQTNLTGLQQHYSQWQTLLAQMELADAQNGNYLRVAQPAEPGLTPVRPRVLLYTALGFVIGLFLGIALALLYEQLDTRVRTSEELTELLSWPMLATVWRVDPAKKESVINPIGVSANAESYRILRTNIGFSSLDKPLRTLVVTSALPGDGKSTVAANLAIFMAKAGKNVLLVDADLRRSTMHEKFGLPVEKMGLTNAVLAFNSQDTLKFTKVQSTTTDVLSAKGSPTNSIIQPFLHSVNIPNLRVMPSGPLPPNPSELLDSEAMGRLTQALVNSGADIVIFDTPPLLGLSDASLLASKTDGTLVVTDTTQDKKGNLNQVKGILEQAGARVLGYVINKQAIRRGNSPYSYYYYRSQNGHSTGDNDVRTALNSMPVVPATPPLVEASKASAEEISGTNNHNR